MNRTPVGKWKWRSEFGVARAVTTGKHVAAVRALLKRRWVLLDTETDGLARTRRLRLVQVGWGDEAWLLDPYEPRSNKLIGELYNHTKDGGLGLVCHNAAFDLFSLGNHRWGTASFSPHYAWVEKMAASGQVRDTMVAAQVLEHLQRNPSLASLAGQHGVHNDLEEAWVDEADRLGLSDAQKYAATPANNPSWLRYAAHDIWQLWAAYAGLRRLRAWKNALVLSETRVELLYSVMTHRGMCVDMEAAGALWVELDARLARQRERLAGHGIPGEFQGRAVAAALLDSGAKLHARTPTGEHALDRDTLSAIRKPKAARKLASAVLAARSTAKDRSSILTLVQHSEDGRVHPRLWRIGTVTGRSSCSEPNLQQLNKHSGDARVRAILTADPGCRLVTVDYAGMELRVVADLTGDEALLRHLRTGADIHGEIAAQVYGADHTTAERNAAKRAVFSLLYGAGDATIARHMGRPLEQAAAIREAWRASYPRVTQVADRWIEAAADTGRTVLPNGWTITHRRGRELTAADAYVAVNHHVQGWAAFVFRVAVGQVADAGMWPLVCMVVHDEFVLSVPEAGAKKVAKRFAEAATVEGKHLNYTTNWEVAGGRHWTI